MNLQTLEELDVQSQYRLLEKLRASAERFKTLYLNAPIGLWEQDWSMVKPVLNVLKNQHGADMPNYLRQNPQEIRQIAGLIKVLTVNDLALAQLGSASGQALPTLLDTYLTESTLPQFAAIFAAFASGKIRYQTECQLLRLDGGQRYHDLNLIVPPGHEHTMDCMIVTSNDITERKQIETALKKSEEFSRMSQIAGGIGTWEINLLTDEQTWSDTIKSSLGFPSPEQPGWEDFLSVVHPADRQAILDATQAHFDHNQKYLIEYRIYNQQGNLRWMCSSGNTERDVNGKPIFFRGVVQDITDRKLVEEKLRLNERIFQTTQESIMVTDAQCQLVDVNEAFSKMTGYSRSAVLGQNPRILQSGLHDATFYTEMWRQICSTGHWNGEIWNRRKDGELYAVLMTISTIHDDYGQVTHYVSSSSDITLQKQHEKQLEHIAHYDALTGIPNRVLLIDRMQQAQAQTRREQKLLGVCYLDLDGFKPINDTLGHEAGDRVLVEIAKRIGQALRGGDTVARLGGDEFVILLLGLENIEECHRSLERLLNIIAGPILLDGGQPYTVTASIGITLFPSDHHDSDTLLRHADQAMYLAKQLGKNRYYIFDPGQEMQIRQHKDKLRRIEQGLNCQEFELFYQPKVELSSYKVVGVEALLRWRHPERGLLSPEQFLSLIENSPLENRCGEWVIETAIAQLDTWLRQGLNLQIGINISANHLQSAFFVEKLQQILAEYPDVPPQLLQIEILETAALVDIPKAAKIIEECAEFGVSFALDDFGTGYSSLSYLRRLPAETLKIDLSFVRDMLIDRDDRAIVKGVISLGHAFNRITVAEGVETQAHFDLLRDMGCDIGQGYGIARPMPASEIHAWYLTYAGTNYANTQAEISFPSTQNAIEWKNQFEIGHKRIDTEHRFFLDLIIAVNQEVQGNCNQQRLQRLLHEVSEYAKFHFVSEENIMEEFAYPAFNVHQVLHRQLLSTLSDISYDMTQKPTEFSGLVRFLFEWFTTHTITEDKKIALFIDKQKYLLHDNSE